MSKKKIKLDEHNELIKKKNYIWSFLYKLLKGSQRVFIGEILLNRIANNEGGYYLSKTVREIFERDFNIYVDAHSYGAVFSPRAFSENVQIGRYCSISKGVRVYTKNHPIDTFSTHPYFYNSSNSFADSTPLIIGNDVWIGYGAIILPGCKKIGDGAIIGAGSIVTKDVEPYSVVGGNPAKTLKKRFSEARIKEIQSSKWWNEPKTKLI